MRISTFLWDDRNIDHVAAHGAEPWEVEQVFGQAPKVRRARDDRHLALGRTQAGRYLVVVFRYLGNGVVRVLTAREMSVKERRSYGKK